MDLCGVPSPIGFQSSDVVVHQIRRIAVTMRTPIGTAAATSATQLLTCSRTERSAKVTIAHNLPAGSSPFTLKDSREGCEVGQFTREWLSRYPIETMTQYLINPE